MPTSFKLSASGVLREGPVFLTRLRERLEAFMQERGFGAVDAMRGRVSLAANPDPDPSSARTTSARFRAGHAIATKRGR
ncbi:MAG: hypothetical protein QM736_11325 [Vicinamibacterales bacterium]